MKMKTIKGLSGLISRVVSILACAMLMSSCSPTASTSTPPPEEFFEHRVSVQGETLGIIAGWYTGSAANHPMLRTSRGDGRLIRLGDTVYIPKELVKRSTPITREYVGKYYSRGAGKPAEIADPSDAYGGKEY
jgi:hypothetical protein